MVDATIRQLIDEKAKLSIPARDLGLTADLYELGLTPFTAIKLLLALEREFEVEFSEEMLNRHSVSSIEAICSRIWKLKQSDRPKAA